MILSALIDTARQGDTAAIAALLAETLDVDHLQDIKAVRRGDRLELTLVGTSALEQGDYIQSIYVPLAYLEIPGIKQVRIEARHGDHPRADWVQQGALQSLPLPEHPAFLQPAGLSGPAAANPTPAKLLTRSSSASTPAQVVEPHRPVRRRLSLFVLVGLLSGGGSALYFQHLSHQTQLQNWEQQKQARQTRLARAEAAARIAAQTAPEPPPPEIPSEFLFSSEPTLAPEPAVVIKAVGDIIPGTDYPRYRMPQDPNYLFRSIEPFLQKEADILFGNFESTMTSHAYSAKDISRGSTFAFRTPPSYGDVIKSAGFDVMSVANNHSFDFGEQGFADTIANLESSGIQATGRKGQITYTEANEVRLAFIAFSYFNHHNNMNDLAAVEALIRQADEQADIIVVSVHAGAEGTGAVRTRNQTEYYLGENRGNLVQFSRAAIDYGADLVLGHGPHVVRAVDLYQDRLIAYSLGNFLGHKTLSNQSTLGVSMILKVGMDSDGTFVNGQIIPVALDPNGVPYLDNHFQGVVLVRQLTRMDFPFSPLEIDDMGHILPGKFIE
ncbi:poly-gamma-glutamate biosynthesis protein [filamentous cyanobacterium CCP5]|nr:poly-gamma-glutamate biosynthesis protein [filamentous cyanobacterium CCP5]